MPAFYMSRHHHEQLIRLCSQAGRDRDRGDGRNLPDGDRLAAIAQLLTPDVLINPSPMFPGVSYHEPTTVWECLMRFRPVPFRHDASRSSGSLLSHPSTSSTPSTSIRLQPAERQRERNRPRLTGPGSTHLSPSPGPLGTETTTMPLRMKRAFGRAHPNGVRFLSDDRIRSLLVDELRTKLASAPVSASGAANDATAAGRRTRQAAREEAEQRTRPRTTTTTATTTTGGDDSAKVARWVTAYAHAVETFGQSATLRYETEQSACLRTFPGEAVNQLLRDPTNFFPGKAPPEGTEWTGCKLRNIAGVADMCLTSVSAPPSSSPLPSPGQSGSTPATSTSRQSSVLKALLEYKRLDVCPRTCLEAIVTSASRLSASNGFVLYSDPETGELWSTDARLSGDVLEICFQIYIELHTNSAYYNMLWNSCDALVFALRDRDQIAVSPIIDRNAGQHEEDLTVAGCMVALALVPLNPESVQARGQLFVRYDSQRQRDEDGESQGDRETDEGDSRTVNANVIVVDRPRSAPSSEQGDGSSSDHEDSPSLDGRRRTGRTDTSIVTADPDPDHTLPAFPSHLPDQTWDQCRPSLGGPRLGKALTPGNASPKSLRIGRSIGRGRLWRVYEGTLRSADPTGSSSDLDISLDLGVWASAVPRPTTASSNPTWSASHPLSSSEDETDSAPASPSSSSSPASKIGSLPSSPASSSSTSTDPTSSSSMGGVPDTVNVPVAIKIFDAAQVAREALAEGLDGVDATEYLGWASAAAKREVDMVLGPLRSDELDAAVTPKCFGAWEWRWRDPDDARPRLIVLIEERLYPVFPDDPSFDTLRDEDKIDAARLVQRLHRLGWAHGDVEPRHVMTTTRPPAAAAAPRRQRHFRKPIGDDDPMTHWRLIDFDRASHGADAVGAERAALCRKLGFVRWVDVLPEHMPAW